MRLLTLGVVGVLGLLIALVVSQRTRRDPVTILSGYLAFLYLIPARLVVGPLSDIGTPAVMLAMLCLWWWFLSRVNPDLAPSREPQPLRVMLGAYVWFCAASVAYAHTRPLSDVEANGSIRFFIALLAASGVALLVADGVRDRERLNTLLRRLVLLGAILASIGIVQFTTGWDPVQYIRIPGLSLKSELLGVGTRSIFNRPFGTALHPIEYGVVCASLLPIALHLAFHEQTRSRRQQGWVAVALLGSAAAMSLSRSATVAGVVGLLTLSMAWSMRRRLHMAAMGLLFSCAMWAVVPGLLGTIRGLFLNAATDPSITARTDRLPRVIALISESPFIGIGFGTYNQEDYFLLDNEIYRTAIQIGLIGLLLTLALFIGSALMANVAGRRSADRQTRHLGQALAASILALTASMATFDAFFYRILYGTLFLLVGCAAALWVLVRQEPVEPVREATADPATATPTWPAPVRT